MSNPTTASGSAANEIVFVSLAPGALTKAVGQRLSSLFPQSTITEVESLKAASQNSKALIVLAQLDPVEAIASRLADQKDGSDAKAKSALASWVTEVSTALEATRPLRRRLWLIDARAMADGRFQEPAAGPKTVPERVIFPAPGPIYLALADVLIRNDEQATRLAAEIDALRRGPGGRPMDLDLTQAALSDLQQFGIELGLMREALTVTQADLEAATRSLSDANQVAVAHDELIGETARLRAELTETQLRAGEVSVLREELSRVQAELSEHQSLKAEVSLLRETLSFVQAELEANVRVLEKARQDRTEHEVLTARFAALERGRALANEHLHLRQQVLGAEILKMSGILSAERRHFVQEMQGQQEAIALLQDLLQANQAEIGLHIGQIEAARADNTAMEDQLQQARNENITLQDKLNVALHEINLLHASTSWQVTAPLRAVKRRLAGQ